MWFVLGEFIIFLNYVANVASYLCNLCISPTLMLEDHGAMFTCTFLCNLSVYMFTGVCLSVSVV